MPKPTQIIRHHMTWQNHQVCVGYCSSKTFVWGKLCFSPVTAIYNQQLEVWGICKAITTGSDPCPCLQFSKQGGEEYIVQQMSQNYQPRTTPPPIPPTPHHPNSKCAKFLYSTTREIGEEDWGCRVHSLRVVFLIKCCIANKKKKKKPPKLY